MSLSANPSPVRGGGEGERAPLDSDPLARAYAEFNAGCPEAAEAHCRGILREQPDHAEALHVSALCAARLDHRPEALALLERAIEIAPDQPQYHYNHAVTCQELGLRDEAMLGYQACLRLQPDHADALWNYGDLLRLNEHFEQAVSCFEKIVALGRSYPELYHRLGVALHGLEKDERAAAAFERALAGPCGDKALTYWEYCHVLLTLGRFAEGWDAYDRRFAAGYRTTVTCHPFPQPLWQGEPLAGKKLLVHGEQGLGDEIMFTSIVPELIAEGARVILACQPPLVRLFTESFPEATARPHQVAGRPVDVSDLEPIDYQITFGSLPGRRRREVRDFNRYQAYIKADPERTARFRERLRRLAPASEGRLKVGLTWGSNPATGVDWGQRRAQHKSVPLEALKPLAALADHVQFVSLQNRDLGPQAAHTPWLDLVDFHRGLLDMADTAALVAALDLVISVDTSIAHLAGAMGKETWLLLMRRADWRWLRDTDKSVWYPSVRLFRQEVQGDWAPVIEAVTQALHQRATT